MPIAYLEGSSQTEDAIIRLLRWQTLERQENGFGFFGDQVISPIVRRLLVGARGT
jgi:hypothetical protein